MSQDSFPLSHAPSRIGGVLLAAGRGRRFDPSGKQHKLAARIETGQTLLRASAVRLLDWVDTLTVVLGAHNAGLVRELADLPLRVVVCLDADAGPGVSLRHGLTASLDTGAHAPLTGLIVCLADMPWIEPATYARLRDCVQQAQVPTTLQAWRAQFEGKPGHPVALTAALARYFLAMPSDPQNMGKGLAPLWRQHPGWITAVDVADQGCVRDIDRLEDLSAC